MDCLVKTRVLWAKLVKVTIAKELTTSICYKSQFRIQTTYQFCCYFFFFNKYISYKQTIDLCFVFSVAILVHKILTSINVF